MPIVEKKEALAPPPPPVEEAKPPPGPSKPSGDTVWYAISKEAEEWFLWKQQGGKTERLEGSHSGNVIQERVVIEMQKRYEQVHADAVAKAEKGEK